MHIGRNIKHLRKVRKINQGELADMIDKQRSMISAYESGQSDPPITILVKIAEIFDVTIDDLVHTDLSKQPSGRDPEASRMKKSSLEYAQDIEADRMTVDELEAEIGEINLNKVFRLMELRINELELALKQTDPELAKKLKIE